MLTHVTSFVCDNESNMRLCREKVDAARPLLLVYGCSAHLIDLDLTALAKAFSKESLKRYLPTDHTYTDRPTYPPILLL